MMLKESKDKQSLRINDSIFLKISLYKKKPYYNEYVEMAIMNNNKQEQNDYDLIISECISKTYELEKKITDIYVSVDYPKFLSNKDKDIEDLLDGRYNYIDLLDNYEKCWNDLERCLTNLSNFYNSGYNVEFNPNKKLLSQKEEYEWCIEDFINKLFNNTGSEYFEGKEKITVFNKLIRIYDKLFTMKISKKVLFLYKQKLYSYAEECDLDVPEHIVNGSSSIEMSKIAKRKNIDEMDGIEFENYCLDLLKNNGFIELSLTKTTGDQGVDIIGYKDDIKYAFQCKCYSQDVGNAPIQEVVSGKVYYDCDIAVVITNRHFTPGAFELAKANRVKLWDREKLLSMIK